MDQTGQIRTYQRHLFSLVELLVVLAIVTVLMGIGIAAYQGVKGHKGSEAGAQRMADMIALARQYAISENTRVALLLPDKASNFYSGTDYEDELPTWHGSGDSPGIMMQVCTVDASGGFVDWLDVGGWVFLPQNSYFSSENLRTVNGVAYPDASDSKSCSALIFLPNGTLQSRMTGAIYVEPFSTSDDYYLAGKARRYRMTVNWLTGATTTQMRVSGEWR